jgi:flavodoxin
MYCGVHLSYHILMISPKWRLDMRALIVYDSVHGNTAQIAQAISDVLDGEVSVRRAGDVKVGEVEAVDLLIVGSPTHGGWFTEAIKAWLEELPATGLQGVRLAAFDTRTPPTWLSRIFGFAAPRIADRLEKKGGVLLVPAAGFLVKGIEGPLLEGELAKAQSWAREIAAMVG